MHVLSIGNKVVNLCHLTETFSYYDGGLKTTRQGLFKKCIIEGRSTTKLAPQRGGLRKLYHIMLFGEPFRPMDIAYWGMVLLGWIRRAISSFHCPFFPTSNLFSQPTYTFCFILL